MNHTKTILWGLLQALIVIIICFITLIGTIQLQKWEAPNDGFLDDLALLLLFGIAALVCATVILARPVYLWLQQRMNEGFILLISTIVWLVILLGCIFLSIICLHIHTVL
jgi:hypothetical protein